MLTFKNRFLKHYLAHFGSSFIKLRLDNAYSTFSYLQSRLTLDKVSQDQRSTDYEFIVKDLQLFSMFMRFLDITHCQASLNWCVALISFSIFSLKFICFYPGFMFHRFIQDLQLLLSEGLAKSLHTQLHAEFWTAKAWVFLHFIS